ncbi:CoA ester lyase [Agrobacterium sp. MOPV5]|uniref:HpcH/HpaI aldolase/citrate lyase family protein n=1 Tax=Agrobacterium leguminum TaxID=2792015 RepID=UPI0018C1E0E9|nr:CoA ester lyase [Agrobacterium leguminum]MBG0512091.1 CoA ester lyase [Agrobacterium leguminum]
MTDTRKLIAEARSFLFVPGDRQEWFQKALSTLSDIVIVDLEDAVAEASKGAARLALKSHEWGKEKARVLVRVNASDTPWFKDDLDACRAAGVQGIMLSKTQEVADVARAVAIADGLIVVGLIETAAGIANVASIAQHESVARLAFGSIDYCLDLCIAGDGIGLASARSELVLRSRLANRPAPIEGVTADFRDDQALVASIGVAKSFGFGAKLAIHPGQIELINNGFMPADSEVNWAREVMDAYERSDQTSGSFSFRGGMIDKPILARAKRILGASPSSNANRTRSQSPNQS